MIQRRFRIILPAIFILSCALAVYADFKSDVTHSTQGFKDITLTCRVLYADHAALKKIGKDFNKTYEFKSTTVKYKSPDKLKMEGKLGMVKAMMIINGDRKATIIPAIRLSKKEDIGDEPHKRQSDFDIGIITGSLWRNYVVLDTDIEKGSSGNVYKITFVRENSREKKHICWIDADTLKLLKMEKYESDGSLKSRYIYTKHSLVNGLIWVPGRIDVYNESGKLAATTAYEDIKVNTGLADSVFKI